ncbi:CPBP family intramembrane glutamic endopeptidase [Rhodanobacter sp. MP7CTX1]|uniref:CPBP family intramembrane glutamic endopeptidase n=1 Tax=Rhodanobacter sp. MP7CTX1 TaxID=2723084 RepID=UPI00161D4003|nr:CPBP family intramembrane glutamic endopeptidase [Rhodanobacter sp. MP7CTX1]MBB6186130.1 membrane protease YdiL (CAAX protease family) [Rhodanobacter sp. MP7CTX1]
MAKPPMQLLPVAQDLFTAFLVLLTPLISMRRTQQLRRCTSGEARITSYQFTIWKLWVSAAVAVLLAYPTNLNVLPDQEHVATWLGAHLPVFLVAAVATTSFVIIGLRQGFRAMADAAWRKKVAKAVQTMRFMLPVSAKERRYWIMLSLSAGICEELLYRGFLMHYLSGLLAGGVALGVLGAWPVASTLFGLAHVYQGVAGVIRATIAGLLLGLIAILTGQLILPILLHALFDLQMLWMYRPVDDDPDIAEKLIQGCTPSEL